MRKRLVFALAFAVIIVVAASAFAAIEIYQPFSSAVGGKKPFYVGVTYCGNSTVDAEQLIDRVKNYTNLFVLDSGTLIGDVPVTEQICDYAVKAGLSVILYYSNNNPAITCDSLVTIAQERWGSHFLGLYYNDEKLAGKVLSHGYVQKPLQHKSQLKLVSKGLDGSPIRSKPTTKPPTQRVLYDFLPSNEIEVDVSQNHPDFFEFHSTYYFLKTAHMSYIS